MGYNSVVMICNDAIDVIEKDPQGWWQKAWSKLCGLSYKKSEKFGYGNACNYFDAVWNQHADFTGVIFVGGNCSTVFGSSFNGGRHSTEEEQIKVLKEILREKGYSIRKLPKK